MVELIMESKPQLQSSSRLSRFVEEHDGPNDLHIVYYNGHETWMDFDNHVQLSAGVTPLRCQYKDAVWRIGVKQKIY